MDKKNNKKRKINSRSFTYYGLTFDIRKILKSCGKLNIQMCIFLYI